MTPPQGPAVLDEDDRDLPHTLPSTISPSPSSDSSKVNSSIPTPSRKGHEEQRDAGDKPCLDCPLPKGWNSTEASITQDDSSSFVYHDKTTDEFFQILVGPMPPDLFLAKFFPNRHPEDSMPPPHRAFDKVPVGAEKESHLYQSIVDALNTSSEGGIQRCPGITFFYTGDKEEKPENEDEQLENEGIANPNPKFDIVGYVNQDPIVQGLPNMRSDANVPFLPQRAQLVITLKIYDIAKDPASLEDTLEFPPRRGPNSKDLTRLAREELLSTVNEIFSRQLRNFLFTLLLTPNEARFFRWDHAGVVMSAAFDYRKEPGILCRFLWQFGNASNAQRGWDGGVVRASTEEEALFKDGIERHVKSQLGDDIRDIAKQYKRHYDPDHVVKLPVRHTTPDGVVEERPFLVSRPVARSGSMASRATRGYWAMDLETKKIVFLKDTWRTNREDMQVEGDILQSIEGIPNVPSVVCYGDVGDMSSSEDAYITQTDLYRTAEWNAHRSVISRVTPRIHYRQVTKEAGYPLTHLAGSKELLQAVRDVYHALEAAYVSDGRMHRDVSTGNIILFADDITRAYGNRRGILIDWELSCKTEAEEEHERKHWRTGTWAFMSLNTLALNPRPHALVHDAESLVYVVFYCAILFLKWDYSPDTVEFLIKEFFGHHFAGIRDTQPFIMGGAGKALNLVQQGDSFTLPTGLPVVIQEWLQRTVDPVSHWVMIKPLDRTAEVQKKMTRPLFDLSGDIFKDIPVNDREYGERPTPKGRSRIYLPATHSSAALSLG